MTRDDLAVSMMGFTSEVTSQTAAKRITASVFEALARALENGTEVTVHGFGKFTPVNKPARQGRNPATGEAMTIEAKTVVKFKPLKALKDRVNG